MWGCMCWTGPFKFRWSRGYTYNSSYYHHQIESINLCHCCHIFRGCVSGIVVPSYAVRLAYNYISGQLGFVLLLVCSIMSTYTTWWSYSFVCTLHYLIIIIVKTLSEGIDLLKCLSGTVCSIVCLRLSQFSGQLYFMQYIGLCVFSLFYLIIIIKSEEWSICYCLGLGHEKKGVRCISFYILISYITPYRTICYFVCVRAFEYCLSFNHDCYRSIISIFHHWFQWSY